MFKLAAGVDRATFEEAVRTTSASVRALPGFLDRELFHDPEHDTWVDVDTWSSREVYLRYADVATLYPEISLTRDPEEYVTEVQLLLVAS